MLGREVSAAPAVTLLFLDSGTGIPRFVPTCLNSGLFITCDLPNCAASELNAAGKVFKAPCQ